MTYCRNRILFVGNACIGFLIPMDIIGLVGAYESFPKEELISVIVVATFDFVGCFLPLCYDFYQCYMVNSRFRTIYPWAVVISTVISITVNIIGIVSTLEALRRDPTFLACYVFLLCTFILSLTVQGLCSGIYHLKHNRVSSVRVDEANNDSGSSSSVEIWTIFPLEALKRFAVDPDVSISCSICLEDNDMSFVTIHCGHSFHLECLSQWLTIDFNQRQVLTCPLCRNKYTLISDDDGNRIVASPREV